jgi:hypothetical protein
MTQPRLLTMLCSLLTKEPTATEMSLATVYERVSKRLSNVVNKHYALNQLAIGKYKSQIFNMILGLSGIIRCLDSEEDTTLSLPQHLRTTEHTYSPCIHSLVSHNHNS